MKIKQLSPTRWFMESPDLLPRDDSNSQLALQIMVRLTEAGFLFQPLRYVRVEQGGPMVLPIADVGLVWDVFMPVAMLWFFERTLVNSAKKIYRSGDDTEDEARDVIRVANEFFAEIEY